MEYARLTDPNAVVDALAGRRGWRVPTSGSTGAPRDVLLGPDAVVASARATELALGGPGHWLLALPTDRIAGAMVLARARLSGAAVTPTPAGPFTAETFADAAAGMPAGPRYTALVPTQVRRLAASAAGRDALASFDAVLVGGAAMSATAPGARLVATYGMTETAGGCVYDGRPIGDTEVRIEDGLIWIATSSLADDYDPADPAAWRDTAGRRWLVTSDLGEWAPDGSVRVLGRADHVIVTGGAKVHPRSVEAALEAAGWPDSAVVGAPDAEWGEAVVAAFAEQAPDVGALREALRDALPRHALPRRVLSLETMPRLASGKIDYVALRDLAAHQPQE